MLIATEHAQRLNIVHVENNLAFSPCDFVATQLNLLFAKRNKLLTRQRMRRQQFAVARQRRVSLAFRQTNVIES